MISLLGRRRIVAVVLASLVLGLAVQAADVKPGLSTNDATLAQQILQDRRLDQVETMALQLLKGFNAGTSYGEIWIRDFNTFIDGSLQVHPRDEVKERLLLFFKIQGTNGNIPDGAIKSDQANVGYKYMY